MASEFQEDFPSSDSSNFAVMFGVLVLSFFFFFLLIDHKTKDEWVSHVRVR